MTKIYKASTSDYDAVNTESIVRYIREYSNNIVASVNNNTKDLSIQGRTQLKAIAAELETVNKRLDCILQSKY